MTTPTPRRRPSDPTLRAAMNAVAQARCGGPGLTIDQWSYYASILLDAVLHSDRDGVEEPHFWDGDEETEADREHFAADRERDRRKDERAERE